MVVRDTVPNKAFKRGRMLLCSADTVEHRPRVEM
jgi:hypothetical protein